MRYTYEQYNAIITDACRTIASCKDTGELETFNCISTSCCFCPLAPTRFSCWTEKHTAAEWQSWLDGFMANNDPDRPYTVEIPADVVDVIDTALHTETLDDDTRYLLRIIQKQINDQNRN